MTASHATQQPPPTQQGAISPIAQAAAQVANDRGRALFDLLRQKWKEVPAGIYDRADTTKLLALSDWELRDYWESVWHETSTGPGYATRGWYQEMYRDQFCGKRVLEIGSGCGIDGLYFIRNGAQWYFADIVPSNLQLIRRLLDAFDLDCEGMTYIEDLGALDQIPGGFDFVYCNGSMINVPFHFSWRETLHLVSHLRPGGRWVELCYPRERWSREGGLPFAEWGKLTDGEATPWVEWYDLQRLRDRFAPVAVRPLLAFNYYDDDYNWFDLRVDMVPSREQAASFIAAGEPKRLPIGLSPAGFSRHGATTIEPVNTADGLALRVKTAPRFWSYAIHGALSADTLRHAAAGAIDSVIPAVELVVSVEQGRLGVGLMAEDLASFVGLEQHFPKRDEPYVVRIACPPGLQRYNLMMRNTQGGDIPSVFTVHQMMLTSIRPEAPNTANSSSTVIALTTLLRRHTPEGQTLRAPDVPVYVRVAPAEDLDRVLGYAEPSSEIALDRSKLLGAWVPADDDTLLAYLRRNQPTERGLVTIISKDETLQGDTEKALNQLESGGLLVWRDFCPVDEALSASPVSRAATFAIHQTWRQWSPQFAQIFWVRPSHLLIGVKR